MREKVPDRVPRFEVWIDGLFDDLGISDPYSAYPERQDVVANSQGEIFRCQAEFIENKT